GALRAGAFDRVAGDQHFARRPEVLALLQRVDDWTPVVAGRYFVELHVVDRIVGVDVVAGAFLIGLGDRPRVFRRRRNIGDPVVHVVEQRQAAIVAEARLRSVDAHAPAEADAAVV